MAAPQTDIEADTSSPSHLDLGDVEDEISSQPKDIASKEVAPAKPVPTSEDTLGHQQAGPSPTDSSGTDSTYIEDDTQESREHSNSSMAIRPPTSDEAVSQVASPQNLDQVCRL